MIEKTGQAGVLNVVGIGPGAYDQMTIQAARALLESQVIVGYTVYVELVRKHFPDKEFLSTPMKQEALRCRMALLEAAKGQTVSMICSGDSGIYGMSGLILDLAEEYGLVDVRVIPGVTAAVSGAAVLGAPLGHDFAVISLSDLLTPMELIEKRLECAAAGDLVICLYNPSSKKRIDYLKHACDLVLKHQSEDTVCAIAKNIGREGEAVSVMSLKTLRETTVDMFTTVYIGNSQTREAGGKMITPRGYRDV